MIFPSFSNRFISIHCDEEALNNKASYDIVETMSNEIEEKTYEELIRIRGLLEILANDKIREKLDSVATTKERQTIWAICDGLTSTEEIANETKVSQRAVQLFVKELVEKDLLYIGRRGYPKRKFEIVPAEWRVEQHVGT